MRFHRGLKCYLHLSPHLFFIQRSYFPPPLQIPILPKTQQILPFYFSHFSSALISPSFARLCISSAFLPYLWVFFLISGGPAFQELQMISSVLLSSANTFLFLLYASVQAISYHSSCSQYIFFLTFKIPSNLRLLLPSPAALAHKHSVICGASMSYLTVLL